MSTPAEPVVTLKAVLHDPVAAGADLAARCPGVTVLSAVTCALGRRPVAVLGIRLEPPQQVAAVGYPSETVHLVVDSDVRIYPSRDSAVAVRTWSHRNPGGDLCLYYRQDDPALTWQPQDGLEQLVGIAQRHLAFEEFARREGRWPVEDAPHGEPARGTHPIRDPATRRARTAWARTA